MDSSANKDQQEDKRVVQMMVKGISCRGIVLVVTALAIMNFLSPNRASCAETSDAAIAREIVKENNKAIIEAFLRYELGEVNQNVTQKLLGQYPSLVFFIKQANRGPLNSLLFLEEQVHKLQDAQKNINSFPYSIAFSAGEKKKILSLRPAADRIISYGIPLMKRDFYRVIQAAKYLADQKKKHPVELMKDPSFRDAIYRQCEPTARDLDIAMGKLSEGELICMRLGFVLEQVTVTNLWLRVNDNKLPKESEYMIFRKKRSEYFEKRLKRIYGTENNSNSYNKNRTGR
ncbi:MAG: hypothetical protein ACP5U1_02810 [Desulfomonilaceae bacterium]